MANLERLWVFALGGALLAAPAARKADVVIYGATPAGICAAIAALSEGVSIVVVEPTTRIGGMVAGGIAITDTGTPQLVGGIARKFFETAAELQARRLNEPPPVMSFRGRKIEFRTPKRWDLEPKIMRKVFEDWVKKREVEVLTGRPISRVESREGRIRALRLAGGTVIEGKVFIDASYEGDLMARSGVSHTWGRESKAKYGESLAGIREPHFKANYSAEIYKTPGIEYMHHGQFGAEILGRDGKGRLL